MILLEDLAELIEFVESLDGYGLIIVDSELLAITIEDSNVYVDSSKEANE